MTESQHLADAEKWLQDRGSYNSEYTEALVRRLHNALVNVLTISHRLEGGAERFERAAKTSRTPEGECDALARASVYRECAMLMQSAVR